MEDPNKGDSLPEETIIIDEEKDEVDVEKLLTTNKKLYARVKEAEAEAKRVKELEAEVEKLKQPKEAATIPAGDNTAKDTVSREEVILFAKGFTEAQVEGLKKISAVEGTGLLATAESDLYKAWNESQEKRRVSESSELPVSGGSPKPPKKIDFKTPGLTDEQHRALFAKYSGR
jgi:hypothetical protein